MSTPALNPLVEKIRAKYPGAYDDMDDAALTKAVLAKYPQYSDLAAPALKPILPQPEAGIGDKAASAAVNTAKGFGSLGQPVYQVSSPGIVMSFLQKHHPEIAAKIPEILHGMQVEKLPAAMVQAFAGLMAGAPETEAPAAARPAEAPAVKPAIPQTVQPTAATPLAPTQPATAVEQPSIPFPPRGPVAKIQYEPDRPMTTGKPAGPAFDTNGITRDIDEDKAIQDAMRDDLGKHGFIARRQANREFAARNSMDTPKGVRIEQARNLLMGGKITDIGASSVGSPIDPIQFPSGLKIFKAGGAWFAQGGQFGKVSWSRVSESDLKTALSAEQSRLAGDDLTQLLEKSREMAQKK